MRGSASRSASINRWFFRVVFEHDTWDEALDEWTNSVEDWRMSLIVACIRFGVLDLPVRSNVRARAGSKDLFGPQNGPFWRVQGFSHPENTPI